MCGIVGYAGVEPAAPFLLKGLEKLEYRGYDSAGIALAGQKVIQVFKERGRLAALEKEVAGKELCSPVGIGHTRWATHGKPSRENAHPHLSSHGTFAVVHNGIIENYAELRSELVLQGFSFHSQTDTEIIANLLEANDTGDPKSTLLKTLPLLRGSFALGVLCLQEPDRLYAVRQSSPLVIGLSKRGNFIASDVTAALEYTRDFYRLEDGDFACVEKDRVSLFDSMGAHIHREVLRVHWDVTDAQKGGYDHFMLKEIMEQPTAARATIDPRLGSDDSVHLEQELRLSPEEIQTMDKISIVACGSAYHVGMVGKYVLEELTGIPVDAEVASEFRYRSPLLNGRTLALMISQSGETADTIAALEEAKKRGAKTASIVNVVGSTIAAKSDSVLYTRAGPEISVATTKAYSAQLLVLYLLGLYFAQIRHSLPSEEIRQGVRALRELPGLMERALELAPELEEAAQRYAYLEHAYFLGRNLDYAVAMEASLKLKEISYIHSEAYPAGELKHGTISLIEEGTFVVALCGCGRLFEKTISNLKEVRARGAEVLTLTTEPHLAAASVESDHVYAVPETHPLFLPSLEVIPMQLLGYYIARARNCDIDQPRNLAKSVTVE